MRTNFAAGLAFLLLFVGCGGAIKVVRVGPTMDPKEDNCPLEFMEDPPTRPYVELAELTTKSMDVPPAGPMLLRGATRSQAADSVLHKKACELGADAVIVIRAQIINETGHMLVAGTAIRYVPPAAESSTSEGQPESQTNPPNP